MNISEFDKNIGKKIDSALVVVKKVFDRKTGVGDYGPWSMQSGFISDGTAECKVLFKNRDDVSALEGSVIELKSTQSKKGLNGLTIKQDTYNDVVSLVLDVTSSAKVAILPSTETEPRTEVPAAKLESLAGESALFPPPAPLAKDKIGIYATPVSAPKAAAPVQLATDRIASYGTLYAKCLGEACGVGSLLQNASNEDFRTIATAFFIQGMKDGLLNAPDIKK